MTCLLEDGSKSNYSGDYISDSDDDGYVESSIEEYLSDTIAITDLSPTSCDIVIEVKSTLWGEIDPIYKDGAISGSTIRKVQVRYARSEPL